LQQHLGKDLMKFFRKKGKALRPKMAALRQDHPDRKKGKRGDQRLFTPKTLILLTILTLIASGIVLDSVNHWGSNAINQAYNQATLRMGLRVSSISVKGNDMIPTAKVLTLANIAEGTDITLVDLSGIRQRLITEPWVEDATIMRTYPNQISIVLRERNPSAIWQDKTGYYLIDKSGIIIDKLPKQTSIPGFIIVNGKGGREKYQDFVNFLYDSSQIRDRIAMVQRVGDRRWNLALQNGILIKFPEGDERRLNKLLRFLGKLLDRTEKAQNCLENSCEIDLRIAPTRVYVKGMK
jgi:cell division protein FtsQ